MAYSAQERGKAGGKGRQPPAKRVKRSMRETNKDSSSETSSEEEEEEEESDDEDMVNGENNKEVVGAKRKRSKKPVQNPSPSEMSARVQQGCFNLSQLPVHMTFPPTQTLILTH